MQTGLHPVPARLNGGNVIAHRPATLARDEICSVVLVYRETGDEYIVWTYNRQNPGAHHGDYALTQWKGADTFLSRHGDVRKWPGDIARQNITFTAAANDFERATLLGLLRGEDK